MLFVLDHDVDVAVGRMLRGVGHRCVSIGSARLVTANDDAVSVFADDRGAVLLTHDQEFILRRRERTFGRHVLLACNEWDAEEVLRTHLDEVVTLINSRDAIVLRISKDNVTVYPNRWL